MVSFVVVSHSEKLAEGVCDLARIMSEDVPFFPAGGMEDGGYGTSTERIAAAIESARRADGTIILVDMGSSVMASEIVLETMDSENVKIADCPIAEGAAVGAMLSSAGAPMDEIMDELSTLGTQKKLG